MEEELHRLAAEMFRTFARFEYALKAAGFHNGDGAAEPNWRSFAESVPAIFDDVEDRALADAIAYITEHPPKKQLIRNGVLEWGVVPPQANSRSDLIFQYVRRVRNNLFHGGKFNGHWFEPERSELLLRHCLTILNASLEASPRVGDAYRNSVG